MRPRETVPRISQRWQGPGVPRTQLHSTSCLFLTTHPIDLCLLTTSVKLWSVPGLLLLLDPRLYDKGMLWLPDILCSCYIFQTESGPKTSYTLSPPLCVHAGWAPCLEWIRKPRCESLGVWSAQLAPLNFHYSSVWLFSYSVIQA